MWSYDVKCPSHAIIIFVKFISSSFFGDFLLQVDLEGFVLQITNSK